MDIGVWLKRSGRSSQVAIRSMLLGRPSIKVSSRSIKVGTSSRIVIPSNIVHSKVHRRISNIVHSLHKVRNQRPRRFQRHRRVNRGSQHLRHQRHKRR